MATLKKSFINSTKGKTKRGISLTMRLRQRQSEIQSNSVITNSMGPAECVCYNQGLL